MQWSPLLIARALVACLVTSALAAPAALAASGEDKTPLNLGGDASTEQAAASGGGGGIARMIVGLAIVLGVIYGLSWVVKQVKASKEGQAVGSGLETLSTLPLGPNRAVHLVRVGSELVLLGSAERGVSTIRTYGEDEAIAAGLIGAPEARQLPAPIEATATVVAPRPALAAGSIVETLRARTVRR
jgi:flagellar protein FliO/FliZ